MLESELGRKSKDIRARQRARAHLERADDALQRTTRRRFRGEKPTQRRSGSDRRSGSQRIAEAGRQVAQAQTGARTRRRRRSGPAAKSCAKGSRRRGSGDAAAPGYRCAPHPGPGRTASKPGLSPGRTGACAAAGGVEPAGCAAGAAAAPGPGRSAFNCPSSSAAHDGCFRFSGSANRRSGPSRRSSPAWRGDARSRRQGRAGATAGLRFRHHNAHSQTQR